MKRKAEVVMILGLFITIIGIALFVGYENPIEFAATSHSEYVVEGSSYYNANLTTITLPVYDGSNFDAYVNFTVTGAPSGSLYELYYSTDGGATWTLLTPNIIRANSYEWLYTGDWSAWNRLLLASIYDDTGYLSQRPLLTSSVRQSTIGV